MSRTAAIFIFLAGLNGAVAVLAGAWAAHGFGPTLIAGGEVLAETASRFQLWHALALLATALAHDRLAGPHGGNWLVGALFVLAGLAFIAGIVGFSGSLYATAVGVGVPGLTPNGGMALIAGWSLLALGGLGCLFGRSG